MDPVTWTGLEANALRIALRLSLRGFAEHLGVSLGTVAAWHKRSSSVRPMPEMQSLLDVALARTPEDARSRFAAARTQLARESPPATVLGGHDREAENDPADVLLTVRVNGRPVTLPLEAFARATVSNPGSAARPAAESVAQRLAPGAAIADVDERAYELFVRGCGLLGTNDRKQVAAAQTLLQRAVDRDPRFARAIAARGYSSWRQYFAGWSTHGQALSDALVDAQAAMELEPESVFAHTTFVRACWDMGWHEQGLEAGRLVYLRKPDSLDAAIAYARALNNAGMAELALPLIDTVLTEDPTHPSAVKLNIWARLMAGDAEGAVTASDEYLARNPADANTRWAVALALACRPGQIEQAILVAGDGLTADPGDVTLWVLLGYLNRLAGADHAAVAAWRDGLIHLSLPDLDDAQANLRTQAWVANLHAALGDDRSVQRLCDRLTAAEPSNGYLRYRLAHALAEVGRTDQSLDMLEAAVACGFLSAQLMRREERFGLATIRAMPRYLSIQQELAARVAACRATYAPDRQAATIVLDQQENLMDLSTVGQSTSITGSGGSREA